MVKPQSKGLRFRAEDREPYLLALPGAIFVGVGVLVMIGLGQVSTLQCDRIEPTQIACTLTARRFLKKHITPIPNGQLQGAEVEVHHHQKGGVTYRVILITKTSKIPLTEAYTFDEGKKRQKANQIDSFINNSEQSSLEIQQDNRWIIYPFGGLFVVAGCIEMFVFLNPEIKKRLQFLQRGRSN